MRRFNFFAIDESDRVMHNQCSELLLVALCMYSEEDKGANADVITSIFTFTETENRQLNVTRCNNDIQPQPWNNDQCRPNPRAFQLFLALF
jgi:hypothetical protein